jgi:hypothetical protein
MSIGGFFNRALFRFTHNPEADAEYRATLDRNREARNKYISELEFGLAMINSDDARKDILPQDIIFLREYYKKQIAYLRNSPMISQEEIDALKENTESQNMKLFGNNLATRKKFKTDFTFWQDGIKNYKEKINKQPTDKLSKYVTAQLEWVDSPASRFVEKYEYEDRNAGFMDLLKEFETLSKMNPDSPDSVDAELAEKERQLNAEKESEREVFNVGQVIAKASEIAGSIIGMFLLVALGVLGASLATNLNVYRSAGFRVLYAIYGFIGFFIVIPYVLGYRWYWKGKRPKFYALLPIVPYHFDNRWAAMLFSWMSYQPDAQIDCLKEWVH